MNCVGRCLIEPRLQGSKFLHDSMTLFVMGIQRGRLNLLLYNSFKDCFVLFLRDRKTVYKLNFARIIRAIDKDPLNTPISETSVADCNTIALEVSFLHTKMYNFNPLLMLCRSFHLNAPTFKN